MKKDAQEEFQGSQGDSRSILIAWKIMCCLYFLGTFGGCFGADLCLRSMRATARAGYREVSCRHHLRFRCNLNHIRTRNRED